MTVDAYDPIVLGSGEGGQYLAWHLARAGERVAVIEDRYGGGSCPTIACLPGQNIIRSAAIAHAIRDIAPELARVGLNASEARQAGIDDRIVGFIARAPRTVELLPPGQLATAHDLTFDAVPAAGTHPRPETPHV